MEKDLQKILRRIFVRASWIFFGIFLSTALLSVYIRCQLQNKTAAQLSQTVRNDLLMSYGSEATKTLQQNLANNFDSIEYRKRDKTVFKLQTASSSLSDEWPNITKFMTGTAAVPICLQPQQSNCSVSLLYSYQKFSYVPIIALITSLGFLIFVATFAIFRRQVAAFYSEEIRRQKEAALGRLSSRICHDLKLPCMIFQKIVAIEDPNEFLLMKPQLQSHLQRIYGMIDNLKRADLEGLVRMEPIELQRGSLHEFLESIAPSAKNFELDMPATLELFIDKDKFERAMANLVLNGFQAGASTVKVAFAMKDDGLEISIENNGPVMPTHILEGWNSPQYRRLLKGLGLVMAKDTVLAHGGSCRVDSTVNKTCFYLSLPNSLVKKHIFQSTHASPIVPFNTRVKAVRPKIWIDEDILGLFQNAIPESELARFILTSNVVELPSSQLVVSRDENVIGMAILNEIGIFMLSSPDLEGVTLNSLKSRLRFLLRPSSEFE